MDSRGSVLIIVIWVCLGLVALTLYFANSMSSELRAADNRCAELEAQQAAAAGTRYASYVLRQFATSGAVPWREDYRAEAMPVGEGMFWFIGRDNSEPVGNEPVYGLVDEASKLNLNTASRTMLEGLPGMTTELADAIIAWRSRSGDEGGGLDAGSNYSALNPPRLNKGAPFESVDEVRLVYGMTLDALFGEDTNRNGALDPNEDDTERSAPRDDQDGQLFAGIAEYVTVHSREPTRTSEGRRRIDIRQQNGRQALRQLFERKGLDPGRGQQIATQLGDRTLGSVAEFMIDAGLTDEEFEAIHTDITHGGRGLVNVNTASEVVLACIPGLYDHAATIVAYRQANPDVLRSFAWLRALGIPAQAIRQAGRYITDQSYQFSADVAAVGRMGRGYARTKTIFDMSNGTPRAIYHQDLTGYGWALGAHARQVARSERERGT